MAYIPIKRFLPVLFYQWEKTCGTVFFVIGFIEFLRIGKLVLRSIVGWVLFCVNGTDKETNVVSTSELFEDDSQVLYTYLRIARLKDNLTSETGPLHSHGRFVRGCTDSVSV